MSNIVDPEKHGAATTKADVDAPVHAERGYDLDVNAKISDFKQDAIDAENEEHRMGVLEAVRAYPMASFWAFIMSFTIVRSLAFAPSNSVR